MSDPNPDVSRVRQLLGLRRAALKERHEGVERDLARSNDPLAADSSDRAIQLENDETLLAIDEAARQEIAAIDEALQRLDMGLYGICKRCNGRIEAARLLLVPQAVVCAGCLA
ncbi:TraR/DksA C4-type zinc finger protein [Povalibacter sp.]|uniref:TraR/DksA family transcriptional regulator n=1 Tax=Povalibacter sp. TaxID=1962978 RepID=UPI002F411A43